MLSNNKSKVNIEVLGFGRRVAKFITRSGSIVELSHEPNHLACMYLCFLHGPMCIFFSFMHLLAAEHIIFTNALNLSAFPTNTSGNRLINCLYSSLAHAISNSPLKLSSITTFTSLLLFDKSSLTSKYVCSPSKNNTTSSFHKTPPQS